MPLMFTAIAAFLVFWLIFFVAHLTAIEIAGDQFYDEVVPHSAARAAVGSAALAALGAWCRPTFDTMFTNDIAWTLLQAIAWFLVFLFVYQFHPWHALGVSLVTMVLVSGLASLGVDSLTRPRVVSAPVQAKGAPPVRKALGAPPPADAPAEKAK
ncbi:MAG: hypothetical protein K2X91_06410 [Thermoleophilia bacterium]|nr:hypothetical protein [Thermoleophilia bacterium]